MLVLGFVIAQARFLRHNTTRSYHSRAGSRILNGFMLFYHAISNSSSVKSRNGFMRTGDGSWSLVLGTTLFAVYTDRLVAFQSTGWLFVLAQI